MKKILSLLMALVLLLALGSTALAAKNKKITELDIPAVLADVKSKDKLNVYHWWTAGGEKQAIQEIIDGFEGTYGKKLAKSNAIPGGAGGAMVILKSCVSGLKHPLQLNTHPCMKIDTLIPSPFETSIFLILLYRIIHHPYYQYG